MAEQKKTNWDGFYSLLASKIRGERAIAGQTLQEVADELGLAGGNVLNRYESGSTKQIPLHIALALSKEYRGDWISLIEETIRAFELGARVSTGSRPSNIFNTITNLLDESEGDIEAFIKTIAPVLLKTLNVGAIAVFRYVFTEGKLERIALHVDDRFQDRVPAANRAFPEFAKEECYSAWNDQFITEKAWSTNDMTHKFITDYELAKAQAPEQVNTISYQWHEMVLDSVLSTMYGIIGGTDDSRQKRYIIRCFNRSDIDKLLLDESQYGLLQKICCLITSQISIRQQEYYLRYTKNISDDIQNINESNLKYVEKYMDLIYDRLCNIGIYNSAILWDTSIQGYGKGKLYGPIFEKWTPERCQKGYLSDNSILFTRLNVSTGPLEVAIELSNSYNIETHIKDFVKIQDKKIFCRLLGFPFKTSMNDKGAIVIPLISQFPFKVSRASRTRFPRQAAFLGC